jgi:hypothetical protein
MSAFLEKHFYKLCVYLSFFKPSEPAVYDETLASSIKQSTQQRAKGRTKREDPSASHQKQNPNRVTKRGKGTKNCSRAMGCLLLPSKPAVYYLLPIMYELPTLILILKLIIYFYLATLFHIYKNKKFTV